MTNHLLLFFGGNAPNARRLNALSRLCDVTVVGVSEKLANLGVATVPMTAFTVEQAQECLHPMKSQITCIGGMDDAALVLTAQLAQEHGFPHWSPEAVGYSSANKIAMRERQRACGVPIPDFRVCNVLTHDVVAQAVADMGAVVIKPAKGEFSQGVLFIENADDFCQQSYNQLIENAQKAGYHIRGQSYLIEEYTGGAMYSIEGVAMDDDIHFLGCVANELSPLPHFDVISNQLPAVLTPDQKDTLETATRAAVQALGRGVGFFHCELRLTENGAKVIEIAARIPGGLLPEAYQRAFGLDLYRIQLDLWHGRTPDLSPLSQFYVLQRAKYLPSSSRIMDFQGMDRLRDINDLWQFRQLLNSGDVTGDGTQVRIPAYYYGVESLWPERLEHLAQTVEQTVGLEYEQSDA